MQEFFAPSNLFTLFMLVLLQAVLGFDNLLYISLESKRAPEGRQSRVRKLGIGLAVVLRIVLLFVLVRLVAMFKEPFGEPIKMGNFFEAHFSIHSLIVLFGGAFILYTAVKEIFHMMNLEAHAHGKQGKASEAKIIAMIVLMNLVFSFDSILSAMALAGEDNFATMAVAIVIGGILMIALADKVATFLQKNRMYEVLGLFVLFVVGIMLVTEGGHLAHVKFFGQAVHAMTKTTFYFVIVVLVLIDIVQGRYQRKLLAEADRKSQAHG